MCSVISHNAGGYSFYKSSEHHRITRFRQSGVPLDRPGHYIYLRDDESEDYWSVSWQPVGKDLNKAKYECRHGLSYSKFICDYNNIMAQQTLFITLGDDVELWKVKIKNNGEGSRRISIFSYLEFSFKHINMDNQNLQMSLYAAGSSYENGIINYDLFYDPESYYYFTSNFEPSSYDCLRDKFLGSYRTETNPIAVERGECSSSTELGGNHCGSLHKRLIIEPGEEVEIVFMLGVGGTNKAEEIRNKYSDIKNVNREFKELSKYWEDKLSKFQCETPNPGLDTMINLWTLYQAETNVVWSRFASFIE